MRLTFSFLSLLSLGLVLLVASAARPQGKQPTQPLDEIVRHFAEKEDEYAAAHGRYNYELSIRVQELSEDGETLGEFTQSSAVDLDPSGRRRQRLLENPHNDLTKLEISRIELDELNFIPLFILTPEQIPEYNVTYLTTERLDEVDTYLFHLEPNHPAHANDRLFEGIVWVDARKLDIVRAHGRVLPARPSGALKEYFRRVEVFREPVDGNLFPTYVRADDVLSVRDVPLKARLVVRFRNHTRASNPAPSP